MLGERMNSYKRCYGAPPDKPVVCTVLSGFPDQLIGEKCRISAKSCDEIRQSIAGLSGIWPAAYLEAPKEGDGRICAAPRPKNEREGDDMRN